MHTLIIDVGCSNLKMAIYAGDRLCEWWEHPTPKAATDILSCVSSLYRDIRDNLNYHLSEMIVISYSDSVFYQAEDGTIESVPVFGIPMQAGLPPYEVSGKPRNSELKGAANALLYLKNEVGLDKIERILPPSTFIAAYLAGNAKWRKWDITHASNSGMWDYERGCWCKEMSPFIEAGVVDEEVVASNDLLWQERLPTALRILVGGMDSVFANANDVPYSSKPYLSLGTWVTASVEAYFSKRDNMSPTRFVIAPNGTVVEQLCFNAEAAGHDRAYDLTCDFFEKRFRRNTIHPVIQVFGGWSEAGIEHWQKHPYLRFVAVEPEDNSFLHQQAARYAQIAREVAAGLHLPVDMHVEAGGI